MRIPTKLGLYGALLAVLFAASFVAADALAPEGRATETAKRGHDMGAGSHNGDGHDMGTPDADAHTSDDHAGHASAGPAGLAIAADGYQLSPVEAPTTTGTTGELSFRILDRHSAPLAAYDVAHEKQLHLIVVRSDGAFFRHVHPRLVDDTWTIPWTWTEAGSYRVFADFVPRGGSGITLSRNVNVTGSMTASTPKPHRTTTVAGYDLRVDGDLKAGSTSSLTVEVSRDGKPVTTLQPYLGAFGHLVILREGDLAYLHAHPDAADPTSGAHSGPRVTFGASAPTAGQYLLYFDFMVEDAVHTAEFVLDASAGHGS